MLNQRKSFTKLATLFLAVIFAIGSFGLMASANPASGNPVVYEITNPYENVNWATTGQYNAAHHTHSTFSDGSNTRRDMLTDKYAKGFDIVAMTDHDNTTGLWNAPVGAGSWDNNWNNIGRQFASDFDVWAFNNGIGAGWASSPGTFAGTRQQENGMIAMGHSNEISANGGFIDADGTNVYRGHHINSFFADISGNIGTDSGGRTMNQVIQMVEDAGGITHLNHPGRYTTADRNGAAVSRDPVHVNRYVSLFMDFESLVGMEIINKWDGESINDRILWDQILMRTMPLGRPVWGFSNDDSHSLSGNGHAWNVMLMPELTEAAVRESMEVGAFYGVSRVDRQHGINNVMPNGQATPGAPAQTTSAAAQWTGGTHNEFSLLLLSQTAPSISNITVNGSTITITGAAFNKVEWIADGEVVHVGNSIDVSKVDGIGSYVRAELVGTYGVAYTQPFGVTATEILPTLGLNAFNNGTCAQVPGMAGTIRIWTQLNGTNSAIPMRWDGVSPLNQRASLDLTAVDQNGNNAAQYIRVNFVGNRPQDGMVNYMDVTKPAGSAWQTITLTINSGGQSIELLLTNNRYVAP